LIEKIIAVAKAGIGVKESPKGSNKVKYNTWYYGKEVSGGAVSVVCCVRDVGIPRGGLVRAFLRRE
jgi:hypothetical protein